MSAIREKVRHFYTGAVEEGEKLLNRPIDPKGSFHVSQEWTSLSPKTPEEYEEFYNTINYIDELCWLSKKRKVMGCIKLMEALKKYAGEDIQSVLDFGAGIGTDSLAMKALGYDVKYYDISPTSLDFFQKRLAYHKMDIPVLKDWRSEAPYDCIVHIEVVAHMHDPLQFIRDLEPHCRWMAFTCDLGIHDENEGGHSQHSDVPRSELWKVLKECGFEKVKLEGVPLPPQLWRKPHETTLAI